MTVRKNKLFLLSGAFVLATALATLSAATLSAQPDADAVVSVDRSVDGPSGTSDDGVDQTSSTTDDVVTTSTPDTLVSASVTLSNSHNHGCIVTGSAEVNRTSNASGVYILGVSLDDPTTTAGASDRRIQFLATADADAVWTSVATTFGFDNLTGGHTFFLSARKASDGTADTTVTNSSIIVDCQKGQL